MAKVKVGDTVMLGAGKVHWTVVDHTDMRHTALVKIKSQLSGNTRIVHLHELRKWQPK